MEQTENEFLAKYVFEPIHAWDKTNYQRGRIAVSEMDYNPLNDNYAERIIQFEDGGYSYRIYMKDHGLVHLTADYKEHIETVNQIKSQSI